MALRDVLDHAARLQKEISEVKRLEQPRRRKSWAVLVCVPLLALSVYSLAARPSFIWGDDTPLPAASVEAGQRMGIYLLAQRIEAFRLQHGQYPEALTEVDPSLDGVQYQLLSDSVFTLRLTGADSLVFRSDDRSGAFLGTANLSGTGSR